MVALHAIILMLIQAFVWILLAYCILSMLLGFGILDIRNRFFYSIFNTLARIVEPVMAPIRNILPNTGGMDFAPMVVLLLIQFLVYPAINRIFFMLATHNSF
ncbi:YggT family protein [Gluconobacter oxydans]|uniref:YggT family protein n=1 Tax=Gluconobacter oxydans TaxID=442 RepID=UPI0039E93344